MGISAHCVQTREDTRAWVQSTNTIVCSRDPLPKAKFLHASGDPHTSFSWRVTPNLPPHIWEMSRSLNRFEGFIVLLTPLKIGGVGIQPPKAGGQNYSCSSVKGWHSPPRPRGCARTKLCGEVIIPHTIRFFPFCFYIHFRADDPVTGVYDFLQHNPFSGVYR